MVVSRRAGSLYYFNLAYGIPVYLHIDLRSDNSQAVGFWWFASTCRHLGIGGKSKDPAVWAAHKNAMKTYNELKRFFAQGVFYGLDETVHCHTLPDVGQSVINCFNLDDKPVQKQIRFRLSEIGLPAGKVKIEGAPFKQDGEEVTVDLSDSGERAFAVAGCGGQVTLVLQAVLQIRLLAGMPSRLRMCFSGCKTGTARDLHREIAGQEGMPSDGGISLMTKCALTPCCGAIPL